MRRRIGRHTGILTTRARAAVSTGHTVIVSRRFRYVYRYADAWPHKEAAQQTIARTLQSHLPHLTHCQGFHFHHVRTPLLLACIARFQQHRVAARARVTNVHFHNLPFQKQMHRHPQLMHSPALVLCLPFIQAGSTACTCLPIGTPPPAWASTAPHSRSFRAPLVSASEPPQAPACSPRSVLPWWSR